MGIGIINHISNPTFSHVQRLASAAEEAGADWLGLSDAFWWRDTWLLVAEAARASGRLEIGPLVTNAYLRHPFHTASALASMQDLAGDRVFVGIGAGGAEVTGAAGISRRDAPERIRQLARLLRAVAAGEALDSASGRTLEVDLRPAPILVAGRADGVLDAAGRTGDRAMLWAVPVSELEHSVALIAAGAASGREAPGSGPELVWAPLVDHGGASREHARSTAAYSVLNSRPEAQARWGIDADGVEKLRARLVATGAASAAEFVTVAALEDLVIPADVGPARDLARRIGATSVAVPIFSLDDVGDRVAWAQDVLKA
jgi:5,10-methylenetetrahydromethanopterin reductase